MQTLSDAGHHRIDPRWWLFGNINYRKKAIIWLVYTEQQDGCRIMHSRNGREFRLPTLPRLSVDGFCAETNTVYKFCGCYSHGHTCLPYRDVTTGAGDTLAQRYERTMARLEQITQAGYQVELKWECDFDKGILADHPELMSHPVVQHSPLNTRDALYGAAPMPCGSITRQETERPFRM